MAESCKGCYHWRRIGSGLSVFACHYCIDEDRLRDCPASECTNHITEKEFEKMRGQRISAETKEMVIQAAQKGVPYKTISKQFGLSYQSASRLAVEAGIIRNPERIKKSPEAPTAMENASEDNKDSGSAADTNIITDVPEVVKQVYTPYNSTVDEAVLERMERLRENIADLQLSISNYETELNALEEYHLKYMEAQSNANG